MAKRQILLFELLKEDDKSKNPESLWDRLFRKKMMSESTPAISEETQAEVGETASPGETYDKNEGLAADEQASLYVRINTYTKVLAGALVVVIFFCGYIFGHSRGWRLGAQERSDIQIAEVRKQPADSEVLEVFSQPKRSTIVKQSAEAEPAYKEVSKNDGKISRKIGFNYLIIQNFSPEGLTTAELARDFLARMSIETTIERFGRNYQLVSLQGFDMSDPQEKERGSQYQKQIQVLGQKFKQVRDSRSVDFRDCYYQRWN